MIFPKQGRRVNGTPQYKEENITRFNLMGHCVITGITHAVSCGKEVSTNICKHWYKVLVTGANKVWHNMALLIILGIGACGSREFCAHVKPENNSRTDSAAVQVTCIIILLDKVYFYTRSAQAIVNKQDNSFQN